MKEIGRTDEGGRVVVLSPKETQVLVYLQDALDKIPEDYFRHLDDFRPLKEADFAPIFGAIWIFTKAKFKINTLRELVESLDLAVLGEETVKVIYGSEPAQIEEENDDV